jgi:N-acetylglucosamine-1-phosphodiester alpha-N-acetylglucosaminidase
MVRLTVALLAGAAAAAAAAPASVRPPSYLPPRAEAGGDDVVLSPWPSAPFRPLSTLSWNGTTIENRPYSAHMGVSNDASLFSFELLAGGCVTRHNVSQSAPAFGCELATNGGFFSFDGACEGDTIVNGTVVTWGGQDRVVFGVLPNKSSLVGYVSNATMPDYGFTSLLSGLGWLVRGGVSWVSRSHEFAPSGNSSFAAEKAPRTAVGVLADGSVALVVADGVEALLQGVDLFEFAEILIEKGVVHAVNLDGGGSSDAVLRGAIWSRPTCTDQQFPICERPVTSITCVRYAA